MRRRAHLNGRASSVRNPQGPLLDLYHTVRRDNASPSIPATKTQGLVIEKPT